MHKDIFRIDLKHGLVETALEYCVREAYSMLLPNFGLMAESELVS